MDHGEARELLELASVEPDGLDRLMAGDTATASALAAHLAGCSSCMDEFVRLRRASAVLRETIAMQPRPELRAETLAFVAAVGRPRGAAAPTAAAESSPIAEPTPLPVVPDAAPTPVVEPVVVAPAATSAAPAEPISLADAKQRRRPHLRLPWLAAAAALVIVTAGVTGYAVNNANDAQQRQMQLELDGLNEVASWTATLESEHDVQHVLLASTSAATAGDVGSLIFSPASQEIVVVANGLPALPAGQEYRCWVEIAGNRERLGRMYISEGVAYWVGDSDALANVPAGSVFGVSAADSASSSPGSAPVLSGTLAAS
jgi:hypothetical protein